MASDRMKKIALFDGLAASRVSIGLRSKKVTLESDGDSLLINKGLKVNGTIAVKDAILDNEVVTLKQLNDSSEVLDTRIDNIELKYDEAVDELTNSIAKETSDREAAILNLANQLNESINNETQDRISADNGLSSKIDTEVDKLTKSDSSLLAKINQEITDRQAADTSLSSKIDAEKSRATAKEDELNNKIIKEITDRIQAVNEVSNSVDNLKTYTDNRLGNIPWNESSPESSKTVKDYVDETVLAESTSRKSEDDKLLAKINQEITDRTAADTNLSSKIDSTKTQILGNVSDDYNNLAKLESKIKEEATTRKSNDDSLSTKITEETNRATAQEQAIRDEINTAVRDLPSKSDIGEIVDDVTIDYSSQDDSTGITVTKRSVVDGTTSSETYQLDKATINKSGLMSKEQVASLSELLSRVSSLEGRSARLLYSDKTDPTADEINTFVTSKGYSAPFEGVAVVVSTTYHIWHYYSNDNVGWKDDGVDSVQQATQSQLGIVKGSTTLGKIYVEDDGSMSLNGYDSIISNYNTLSESLKTKADNTSVVHLAGVEVITGLKKFSQGIAGADNNLLRLVSADRIRLETPVLTPQNDNETDLGYSSIRFRNLFLSGKINNLTIPSEGSRLLSEVDLPGSLPNPELINFTYEDGTSISYNGSESKTVDLSVAKLGALAKPTQITAKTLGLYKVAYDSNGLITESSPVTAEDIPGLSSKSDDNKVVHLEGAETISGAKTFSSTIYATRIQQKSDTSTYIDFLSDGRLWLNTRGSLTFYFSGNSPTTSCDLSYNTNEKALEFRGPNTGLGVIGRLGSKSYPWIEAYIKNKINDLTLPKGTHTLATLDDIPSKLPNPSKLIIQYNTDETNIDEYDGSVEKKVILTPSLIGAVAKNADISSKSLGLYKVAYDSNGLITESSSVSESDIPGLSSKADNSNVVHLDGTETITGYKIFNIIELQGDIRSAGGFGNVRVSDGSEYSIDLYGTKAGVRIRTSTQSDNGTYHFKPGSLIPGLNNATDLGTTSRTFKNLYLGGKINDLTLPTGTHTLATLDDLTSSNFKDTLQVSKGGTGITSMANLNSLVISGASNTASLTTLPSGPSGYILSSKGPDASLEWVPYPTLKNEVTGVKGQAESSYRKGNINITLANLGLSLNGATVSGNASIYAPTTSGTKGQVQYSQGEGKAPIWDESGYVKFTNTNSLSGDFSIDSFSDELYFNIQASEQAYKPPIPGRYGSEVIGQALSFTNGEASDVVFILHTYVPSTNTTSSGLSPDGSPASVLVAMKQSGEVYQIYSHSAGTVRVPIDVIGESGTKTLIVTAGINPEYVDSTTGKIDLSSLLTGDTVKYATLSATGGSDSTCINDLISLTPFNASYNNLAFKDYKILNDVLYDHKYYKSGNTSYNINNSINRLYFNKDLPIESVHKALSELSSIQETTITYKKVTSTDKVVIPLISNRADAQGDYVLSVEEYKDSSNNYAYKIVSGTTVLYDETSSTTAPWMFDGDNYVPSTSGLVDGNLIKYVNIDAVSLLAKYGVFDDNIELVRLDEVMKEQDSYVNELISCELSKVNRKIDDISPVSKRVTTKDSDWSGSAGDYIVTIVDSDVTTNSFVKVYPFDEAAETSLANLKSNIIESQNGKFLMKFKVNTVKSMNLIYEISEVQ